MAKTKIPDALGQPIPYDPDFNGPLKHRSCTDVICLLLFFLFIGCWAGIAIYAFTSGDPNMLLVPKDSYGGRCGLDEHLKKKPYLFFFDLTKCLGPFVPFTGCPTPQICVEACPSTYYSFHQNPGSFQNLKCNYEGNPATLAEAQQKVDANECAAWYLPSTSFLNRCLHNVADRKRLKGAISRKTGDEISELKRHLNKLAMWLSLFVQNTIGYFTEKEQWQQVQAQINASAADLISSINNIKALSQAEQVGQNIVDDMIHSWWQILIGIGISVVICIIYIMIMRWLATPLVWLSLLGVLALLVAAVYFTSVKYIDLRDNPVPADDSLNVFEAYATKKDTWLVLLIISVVLLAIILLILIFLRKRILLAIALVKEGSKAVGSVFSVLFFPIFPWLLQIAITAFTICVALYLATTGEPSYKVRGMTDTCSNNYCTMYKENDVCEPVGFRSSITSCGSGHAECQNVTCKFITMQNPPMYPYLQAFNIVGFLWGTFFASALGQMILASVFATWYWTWNKRNLPFFAVIEASGQTLRYHIGTLAFGSFIITVCRLIRIGLEYVDQKLKKYDNEVTKAILCCCKCFFWCLEKFLKFINRNAYIMCAIHGKNFCFSAKDAFMLLMRNIVRVFVLDKVTDFLFFLGKLFITIGVGALAYLFFATDITGFDNSGLNYNIMPVIVIMIITFFIATMFFNVYSMAVDTLFLCFLEDCERNDGSSEKPYYMSKNLMKIFGKKNKQH